MVTIKKKTSGLCVEAKTRLKDKSSKNQAGTAGTDLPGLLHELQVHQIELEIQNEELRVAQAELEETRDRYADLYDFAPVGYLTLDHEGMIDKINLAGARLLGMDRNKLQHRCFDHFIAAEGRDHWHHYCTKIPAINDTQTIELPLKRGNGSSFYGQLECLHPKKEGLVSGLHMVLIDITERNLAFEALRESEELLRGSHIIAGLGSYVLDIASGQWKSSEMLDNLFGIDAAYDRSADGWLALIHPDDRGMMADYFRNEVLGMCKTFDKEYRIIRQHDQMVRWLRGMGKIEVDANGHAAKMLGTIQDITEYKSNEENLLISAKVFEAQEGMLITDSSGTILKVNKAFTAITGYPANEVIGENPRLLRSGRQDTNFYKSMWASILRKGFWEGEIWNKRKNGEVYPEHLIITAVKNAEGACTHYVGTLTDITLSREAADEIKHLAYFDILTRLPNRRLLQDRLKQAMATSARNGRHGALLFLDLDDFKTLNDTLGHDIGDMLLTQVAQRLESCVREGDTVARLGGDEFVVMLEQLSKDIVEAARQSETIANKILGSLNGPYLIAHHECRSSPSIGAILFKDHEHEPEELLKQADIAMYQAKKTGRNKLCFFDQSMQDTVNSRAALEEDLRKALVFGQIRLHFQIQVDEARTPRGAEALIRWFHPERGVIPPGQFITLAEESGLILPIGQWVLDAACVQIKMWQQDVRTCDLVLAINVSARQFHQSDFVASVHSSLQRHAIKPNLLKLELTESMLLENIDGVISTMNALKKLGVQFSLDDFGTGFSSLQYLKRLPIDQLKIDHSFVRDIAIDNNDKAIVSTIIAMAHNLGLNVIAEGVETNEQLELLKERGCLHFQGFLFSKPVPIKEFEAQLK